jgi:hypothetical protein
MSRCVALLALTLLSGCASRPAPAPVPPEQVQMHESVASAPPRYEVVRRIWVEDRRSAFLVPSYASVDEGRDDIRRQAAGLGANGVINFGCYRMPGKSGNGSRLACNGTAVRFL